MKVNRKNNGFDTFSVTFTLISRLGTIEIFFSTFDS
jgi:hypothetical protein